MKSTKGDYHFGAPGKSWEPSTTHNNSQSSLQGEGGHGRLSGGSRQVNCFIFQLCMWLRTWSSVPLNLELINVSHGLDPRGWHIKSNRLRNWDLSRSIYGRTNDHSRLELILLQESASVYQPGEPGSCFLNTIWWCWKRSLTEFC